MKTSNPVFRHVLPSVVGLLLSPWACGRDSKANDPLSGKKATQVLLTADRFAIGAVGYGGKISQAELSMRALIKRPDAVAECQKIIAQGSLAGQLYALLGLKLLGVKEFKVAVPRYRNSVVPVRRLSGCIIAQTTVGQIARGIERSAIK